MNGPTREDPVRKLAILSFITLDGVMQAPGGPDEDPTGGFKYSGGSFPSSMTSLFALSTRIRYVCKQEKPGAKKRIDAPVAAEVS
jgi:hypothetical protein